MNKRYSIILSFAGSVLLASCGTQSPEQAEAEYKVMTVSPADVTVQNTYPATIRGRQDVDVYPQVSGRLTRVCVTEGEKVQKDQPLFVIDQVPYQAALQTATANVGAATARLATARLTYAGKQELYRQDVISEYDLNMAKNALAIAEQELRQARASETNARNNLSYTVIKSPSAGIVGVLPYREGALVGPGSNERPLTTVSDNSEMHVYFSMSEKQLLRYMRQYGNMDEAMKRLGEIDLILSDNEKYGLKGYVASASGVVDTETGTVSLRAVFPNPNGLLYSGTIGNVLIADTRPDALVIPQSATIKQQDRVLAYKVVDGKAVSALVTVEPNHNGREYIVTSGLNVGDSIIAERVGLLREGVAVKIKKD